MIPKKAFEALKICCVHPHTSLLVNISANEKVGASLVDNRSR